MSSRRKCVIHDSSSVWHICDVFNQRDDMTVATSDRFIIYNTFSCVKQSTVLDYLIDASVNGCIVGWRVLPTALNRKCTSMLVLM